MLKRVSAYLGVEHQSTRSPVGNYNPDATATTSYKLKPQAEQNGISKKACNLCGKFPSHGHQ